MLLIIQASNFSEDASSFRIRILKHRYLLGDIRRFIESVKRYILTTWICASFEVILSCHN